MVKYYRCLCLVICGLLAGCGKQTYTSGAVDYDPNSVTRIRRGLTTMAEIEDMLGDPTDTVTLDEGEEIWVYEQRTRVRSRGKENFFAVPLFNVMSGGADKRSVKTTDRDILKIRFLDGIVDELSSGHQEMTAEYLVRSRDEFERLLTSDEYQKLEFSPDVFETVEAKSQLDVLDTVHGEYREVLLSFDLSRLPPDLTIHRAYLAMLPTSKKIGARKLRKNRPDLYGAVMFLTDSNWAADPGGFSARCFSSDCSYKLSGETFSPGRVFTTLFAPGADRNVYVLKQAGWEYWDLTDLFELTRSFGVIHLRGSSVVDLGGQTLNYAELMPPAFNYAKSDESEDGLGDPANCRLMIYVSEAE